MFARTRATPAGGAAAVTGRVPVARAFLACALLGLSATPSAAGVSVVHIAASGHGVGMPRWWDAQCYVITPAHVVAEAQGEIGIVAMHRRQASAEPFWSDPGHDLAVVKVTSGVEGACVEHSWTPSGALDHVLSHATQGTLRSLGEDGGERRMPVVISEVLGTHLEVAPVLAGAEIAQGQSGSVLEVAGRRAGMLLQVTMQGRGRVIRQDYLEQLLGPVFSAPPWPEPGATVCLRHDEATALLVEVFADAIRSAGATPRTDCGRHPGVMDTLTLTGSESVERLDENWIAVVDVTVVVSSDGRERGRRQLRASGGSTLSAARARAGVAADLREQLEKAENLQEVVGITIQR